MDSVLDTTASTGTLRKAKPNNRPTGFLAQTKQPLRTTKAAGKFLWLDAKKRLDDVDKWDDQDGFDWQDQATTEAERLPKSQRQSMPRVTAYNIAESFNIIGVRKHLSDWHNVKWKVYDECSWTRYDRASRQALHDVHDGNTTSRGAALIFQDFNKDDSRVLDEGMEEGMEDVDAIEYENENPMLGFSSRPPPAKHPSQGDIFVFDFGVVVFWNFSEADEERILETMERFSHKLLPEKQVQVEDLHFQYDPDILSGEPSRIYNDLITLRSPHHLVKLPLSHGLAQSVKLARFESLMEDTIDETKTIPLQMAQSGTVHLHRKEVLQVIGRLFQLRMDVNLVSNVLDNPEILWDRPELEPLYDAMQQYLEIRSRSSLLNTRAAVVGDLMELLNDHLSAHKMSNITIVIIGLICVACVVALIEIWVKAKKAHGRKMFM
jgi:uncharacterized Rmd1/YagE family protein